VTSNLGFFVVGHAGNHLFLHFTHDALLFLGSRRRRREGLFRGVGARKSDFAFMGVIRGLDGTERSYTSERVLEALYGKKKNPISCAWVEERLTFLCAGREGHEAFCMARKANLILLSDVYFKQLYWDRRNS
jgi:hypothetical protein